MNMKNQKIIVSHPTGNANVRAALDGFLHSDLLGMFFTCIATQNKSVFKLLSSLPGLSEFERRSFNENLSPYIHSYPFNEMMRLFCMKAGLSRFVKHEDGVFSVDAIYQALDSKVAKAIRRGDDYCAVYAYEDGALNAFKEARKKDIKCLYDLPIGYWKAARILMFEEIQKRPEWAATLSGFSDSENKTNKKDQELAMADHIYVASSFTASTLKHYSGTLSKISVIPYGFPDVSEMKNYKRLENQKLKLLFVGGLSQRKGIADIFDAVKPLKDYIDLTIVGRLPNGNVPVLNKELGNCNYIPSLAHKEILQLMKENDVLLFPSLFEGFGLVITEAMSQGTPVITTNRTVGPDIITHGENGWIIEAGNHLALREMIERLIEKPELIELNGRAAHKLAAARPWSFYGTELAQKVIEVLA
jgi:glycosyltransferase involved in cell wall biosynthesis